MKLTKTYKIGSNELSTVVVGEGSLRRLAVLLRPHAYTGLFVLCDNNTKKIYEGVLRQPLNQLSIPIHCAVITPGEESKQMTTVLKLCALAREANIDRKGAVLALGGGVVGDIATLLAALYHRGIDCIQIPTTLLAQVDSAIGGKGGVNLDSLKNALGVIRQPRLVIVDTQLLASLPREQIRSGMGEVVKYAIARSTALFAKLEKANLGLTASFFSEIINRSINLKMAIVSKDPHETSGKRMELNFGHTLGHAVELLKEMPHGEAVAVGMAFAIRLSDKLNILDRALTQRTLQLIEKYDLPISVGGVKKEQVLVLMQKDKKARGGKIGFVLLTGIGHTIVRYDVPRDTVERTIEEVLL